MKHKKPEPHDDPSREDAPPQDAADAPRSEGADPASEPSPAAGADTADMADEEIARLTEENRQLKTRLLEATADLDNQAKRFRRESQLVRDSIVKEFAGRMLEVLDNLERALQSAGPEEKGSSLMRGVSMVQTMFLERLKSFGIEPIETHQQRFDPAWHEAVLQEERSDLPPGIVVDELTRGYRMGDRLIRAAQVKTSRAPAPSSAEEAASADIPTD